MGSQNSTSNSSSCLDCCGPKIISRDDLKKTSLSLNNKPNKHMVDVLKKQQDQAKVKKQGDDNQDVNTPLTNSTTQISTKALSNTNTGSTTPDTASSTKSNQPEVNNRLTQNKKLTIDDFTFIRVLGRGAFGKVVLVTKKDNGQVYALKSLKKSDIIHKNHIDKALTEKNVMQVASSPFIVQLKYSFQNASNLYLVMDYLPGGELFTHLKRRGKFPEEIAKFFACEVVLALEYLHDKLDLIYRDLKPENILLDNDGHIKLTDFGLSKYSKGTSFCGTPEYLAPEILLGSEQEKSVDWWSLGCLIYEMMSGRPPFNSRNKKDLYNEILKNQPVIPSYFSENVRNLLQQLLVADPTARLGSKSTEEIKNHVFFSDVNWDDVLHKRRKSPIIPCITNETDTNNFEKCYTNMPVAETPLARDGLSKDLSIPNFSYVDNPLEKLLA